MRNMGDRFLLYNRCRSANQYSMVNRTQQGCGSSGMLGEKLNSFGTHRVPSASIHVSYLSSYYRFDASVDSMKLVSYTGLYLILTFNSTLYSGSVRISIYKSDTKYKTFLTWLTLFVGWIN